MSIERVTQLPAKIDLEKLTKELEQVSPEIAVSRRIDEEGKTELIVNLPDGVTLAQLKAKLSAHVANKTDIERIAEAKQLKRDTEAALEDFITWKASIEQRLSALEKK